MVELAGQAVLAILTRAPSSGGKRRLFAALGREPDPDLLTALLLDTVEATPSNLPRVVAVEPAHACGEIAALLPGVLVVPQEEGTLGDRMAQTMRMLFERGARAVVLIGSDLPDLSASVVVDAFAALRRDPAALVLGPAADGGYYLIGATRVPPVFDGVEWGSDRVLAATIEAARSQGVAVHLVSGMADVDTPADLQPVRARRTRAWVVRNQLG